MKSIEEIQRDREKGILFGPKTRLSDGKNGEQASFFLTSEKAVEGFGHIRQIPNHFNGNIIDGYEVTFFDTPQENTEIVLREDIHGPHRPPDEGMAGANFLPNNHAASAINFAINQIVEVEQAA